MVRTTRGINYYKTSYLIRLSDFPEDDMLDIEILSITISANLGSTLDLEKISGVWEGSQYNENDFPGLLGRMGGGEIGVLLFRSGNVVINNLDGMVEARKRMDELSSMISSMGYSIPSSVEFRIQNIVAGTSLGKEINPVKVNDLLGAERAFYDPRLYPAVQISGKDQSVAMLLFPSGNLFITGAGYAETCSEEAESLRNMLKDNGLLL
jgi:transcription initiation factor TFIID TATA-box-binding protein